MKRPLAVIGFSFLAALRLAFIFGTENALIAAAICSIAGTAVLLIKRIRLGGIAPAVLYSACAALIVLSAYSQFYIKPLEVYYGKSSDITAELCDLPYEQNDRFYYKLKIKSTDIPDAHISATILASSKSGIDISPYDKISCRINIYDRSPDSFYNYNISRGIHLRGSIDQSTVPVVKNENDRPLYYYILMLKSKVIGSVYDHLPEKEAGLVTAMLLSDKFGIDGDEQSSFRMAGVSHIIVVSGFHLTVIVQLVSLILSLFIKNKRVVSIISCSSVFLFMSLTGFTPSVMRAGIMQIAVLLSVASYRKAEPFNSLGLSALIICFINPYTSADIGFLMSFYATLGIITINKPINTFISDHIHPVIQSSKGAKKRIQSILSPVVRTAVNLLSVTLSAIIFTTPVSILYFKNFALYSVPFNLLISPVASILLCVSVIMVIVSLIPFVSALTFIPAFVCKILADYIIGTASLSAYIPYSMINASEDYIPACLFLSLGITVLSFVILKSKKRAASYSLFSAFFIFVLAAVLGNILNYDSEKVSVIDTGDGLSVVIQTPGDNSVIFCGGDYGNYYLLRDYLNMSDINNISYMLLADFTYADTGYADMLYNDKNIRKIHIYDDDKYSGNKRDEIRKSESIIKSSSKDKNIITIKLKDTELLIKRCYKCEAVYFRLYGKSFLVCGKSTDCVNIPEEWRKPDYFIINDISEDADLIKADSAIISDSAEDLKMDSYLIKDSCRKYYYTGGNGSLAVRIYPDGESSVRREKSWLS